MSITRLTTPSLTNTTAGGRTFQFHSWILNSGQLLTIPAVKNKLFFRINREVKHERRPVIVYAGVQPSDPSPNSWKIWILGVIISFIAPFCTNKWGPLQKLKNEVETAVETAERVAEMVEEVAEDVEKVAQDISDQLPENGKLKDSVTFVENLAKVTAKNAHLADQIIDKVEEVEKKVDIFIDQVNDINKKVDNMSD